MCPYIFQVISQMFHKCSLFGFFDIFGPRSESVSFQSPEFSFCLYSYSISRHFSVTPLPSLRLWSGALHLLRVPGARLEQLRPRLQSSSSGDDQRGQTLGGGAAPLEPLPGAGRHHPAAVAGARQAQRSVPVSQCVCSKSHLTCRDGWCWSVQSFKCKISKIIFLSSPGDITHYVILRDGQERYRGDEVSFTDVGGIRPFQEYSYQLRVCNRAGCTDSSQVGPSLCWITVLANIAASNGLSHTFVAFVFIALRTNYNSYLGFSTVHMGTYNLGLRDEFMHHHQVLQLLVIHCNIFSSSFQNDGK